MSLPAGGFVVAKIGSFLIFNYGFLSHKILQISYRMFQKILAMEVCIAQIWSNGVRVYF
jgi:hypothetical protein